MPTLVACPDSPPAAFTWAGGGVSALPGSSQIHLNGDPVADTAAHARRWAHCLQAAAALAHNPAGPVPIGLPAPDEVCHDLAGHPVALWEEGEIGARCGYVTIAGQRHTPEDAERFAWCLLTAAEVADNAA